MGISGTTVCMTNFYNAFGPASRIVRRPMMPDLGRSARQSAPQYKGVALILAAAVLVCAVLELAALSPALAQTPTAARSVWDGVYSKEQADRGDALYRLECARCHNQGPMTGMNFMNVWNGRTADDLFQMIKNTMPQDGPGRLTRKNCVDLLAFTFRANEFPAGDAELKIESEQLQAIRIEPKGGSK